MLKEFREFIMRGSVIDLAVAVVIGAAFGAVITSFVSDVLTPLLGLLGIPDFSGAAFTMGDAAVRYGLFLNALIAFLLVALAIFVFVIKPMNALEARRQKGTETTPTTKSCPYCASEIPFAATRCPLCTSQFDISVEEDGRFRTMGGMENDLAKLKGIGPKRRAMLEKIGVDSVKELQHRDATSLLKMIQTRHGQATGVGQSTVAGWITQAKRANR